MAMAQCFGLEQFQCCGSNIDFNERNVRPAMSNSPNVRKLIDVDLIFCFLRLGYDTFFASMQNKERYCCHVCLFLIMMLTFTTGLSIPIYFILIQVPLYMLV